MIVPHHTVLNLIVIEAYCNLLSVPTWPIINAFLTTRPITSLLVQTALGTYFRIKSAVPEQISSFSFANDYHDHDLIIHTHHLMGKTDRALQQLFTFIRIRPPTIRENLRNSEKNSHNTFLTIIVLEKRSREQNNCDMKCISNNRNWSFR